MNKKNNEIKYGKSEQFIITAIFVFGVIGTVLFLMGQVFSPAVVDATKNGIGIIIINLCGW